MQGPPAGTDSIMHKLKDPIRSALGDESEPSELKVEAVNPRGRAFTCSVQVLPLQDSDGGRRGAIVLMSDGAVADSLLAHALKST